VLVEEFDELGEIGKGTGEPVDLVDDHDVDSFRPDLIEEALKGWTVEGGAREPTMWGRSVTRRECLVGIPANASSLEYSRKLLSS